MRLRLPSRSALLPPLDEAAAAAAEEVPGEAAPRSMDSMAERYRDANSELVKVKKTTTAFIMLSFLVYFFSSTDRKTLAYLEALPQEFFHEFKVVCLVLTDS